MIVTVPPGAALVPGTSTFALTGRFGSAVVIHSSPGRSEAAPAPGSSTPSLSLAKVTLTRYVSTPLTVSLPCTSGWLAPATSAGSPKLASRILLGSYTLAANDDG